MNLLKKIMLKIPFEVAYAHCDIPCGVYDVQYSQMAAHTVIRMTKLLSEVKGEDGVKLGHNVARLTRIKEEHGGIIESELGTLKNDYFKDEHYKNFPELSSLLENTVKLSIAVRQKIDMDSSLELLDGIKNIADIFYKTKGLNPIIVPSGFPTGGEIVMHS